MSRYFYNILLTLAVLPAVWKMPDHRVPTPYIIAMFLLIIQVVCRFWNRVLRRYGRSRKVPLSGTLGSVVLDFLTFTALMYMITTSGTASVHVFAIPLVAVVGMRISVNSWRPTPPEEVSLIKDGFFASLLGYIALMAIALLRTLFTWDLATMGQTFNFLGQVFPILAIFAAAVIYRDRFAAGAVGERTRVLFSPEGLALLVLLVHFVYFETALLDYRSHVSQVSKTSESSISLERLRRARSIFRNYRLEKLSVAAEREVIGFISRWRIPEEVFREIEYVENNLLQLRMEAVERLVTSDFLKEIATGTRIFGDLWRDLEPAELNCFYTMDKWGRLFAFVPPDDFTLRNQSPFQIFPNKAKDGTEMMAEAVDFELSADKRNVLLLDSLGRVFGGQIDQGQIPYRILATVPVESSGRDVEFGHSGEEFFTLDGSGNVWRGLPLQKNPVPEQPLWNWDIARALQVTENGLAIMDGLGGIHCFGDLSLDREESGLPYWSETRAADLEYLPEEELWLLVDRWGDLYLSSPKDLTFPKHIKAEPPIPFTVDAEFSPDLKSIYVFSRGGEFREVILIE